MSHSPSRTSSARRNGQRRSVRLRLMQCVFTPARSSSSARWSFHGSTNAHSMWKRSWSWARAAAHSSRLRPTRSEPLDHPEDTCRHGVRVTDGTVNRWEVVRAAC